MESFVLSRDNPRSVVICSIARQDLCHGIQFELMKNESNNFVYSTKILPLSRIDIRKYNQLPKTIYGTLGLLNYMKDDFLCVITGCQLVGCLGLSKIYRITDVHFLSLQSSKYDLMNSAYWDDENENTPNHPCNDFVKWLSCGFFYFSNDADLTRNMQKQFLETDKNAGKSVWDWRDERFFWNKFMLNKLLKIRKQLPDLEKQALDLSGLLVMIIQGYIAVEQMEFSSGLCTVGIISRLNCRRAGTRFNARGIDDDGNVANFVETETVVLATKFEFSFVQIRGSIPVFWEQQGIQVGNNKIQISRGIEATKPSFDRHFDEICSFYGDIHIIDLLSQKEGHELTLSKSYKELLDIVDFPDRIRRTVFDFHAICKTSGFDGVSLLENYISKSMDSFGYFVFDKQANQLLRLQSGVFRINCLDCLDRTNVVESYIAMKMVEDFFKCNTVGYYQHLADFFKTLWANNGDALSMMYAGTGALKSGFTRTGKRTIAGFMDDVRKTATRFYINNFQDKSRQLIIDQLLGNSPSQLEVNIYNPIREQVHVQLKDRKHEYSTYQPVLIFAATWNVNAQEPDSVDNLSKIFFVNSSFCPDIIAVGFQEIVELTPSQIMSSDAERRKKWEAAVLKSLRIVHKDEEYTLLTSGQLVGASLSLFVKSCLVGVIRNVSMAIKKTGLGGMAGNKGAVGIRFDIYDSNVCIVCCHFAAGQSNVIDRNRDYQTISTGLIFSKNRKIDNHEYDTINHKEYCLDW